eukprot:TRINITY_DN29857_c0_g1_i1.p1 TRINITY_DN29857_c0_g1~~TRINITY_DN29857_c0_g1_i1.p1  ORF type:complete len:387 (+),score=87.98 TRINITY_DN29857_c0_g1_i1:90-1250(+)
MGACVSCEALLKAVGPEDARRGSQEGKALSMGGQMRSNIIHHGGESRDVKKLPQEKPEVPAGFFAGGCDQHRTLLPRRPWKAATWHAAAEDKKVEGEPSAGSLLCSELKRSLSSWDCSRILPIDFENAHSVQETLVQGGRYSVLAARHRLTGQEVAVKRVPLKNLTEARRQQLVSEVTIHLQVQHPSLLPLLAVYLPASDQAVCLVKCSFGTSLYDVQESDGRFSEEIAKEVARQTMTAVLYLHRQEVVHRNLSLETLHYKDASREHVLVTDLGLATKCQHNQLLESSVGSWHPYTAPEVVLRAYGSQADVWSLGVVFYALLVGVFPYRLRKYADLDGRLWFSPLNRGKNFLDLSWPAQNFLGYLLRKDPDDRYLPQEALRHQWLR